MLCSYFQLFNIKPPANQSVELREWTCTNTNLHVCCPIPPPLSDVCRLRCQLAGTATANSSGKKELFIWVQNSLASGSELSQCAWLARIITKTSVEIKLKTRVLTNPTPPGLRWGDPKCRWSVSPVPVELLGTSLYRGGRQENLSMASLHFHQPSPPLLNKDPSLRLSSR